MSTKSFDILLSHGGGGEETWRLIRGLFLKYFSNPILNALEDSAVLILNPNEKWDSGRGAKSPFRIRIAFTTDSFTVSPLFFKGGDIGKLAVAGTVNDLSVMGAKPLYLSAGFIIEEGFPYTDLEKIVRGMAEEADSSGIKIVTGDTKVVPKGNADGLFINTSGIGKIIYKGLSASSLKEGDTIIVSGTVGDHGASILALREEMGFDLDVESDCRCMWDLIEKVLLSGAKVHAMRDPTRGGLSAVLHEWAGQSGMGIEIEEENIPLKAPVRGLCEILGLDPLHLASEGKVVFAVSEEDSDRVLEIVRSHPAGREAMVVGRVIRNPQKRVISKTSWGTKKPLEPPQGELLPRIC